VGQGGAAVWAAAQVEAGSMGSCRGGGAWQGGPAAWTSNYNAVQELWRVRLAGRGARIGSTAWQCA